jgi:hypothetical protein
MAERSAKRNGSVWWNSHRYGTITPGPIRTVARSTSDGLRQLFVMHGDVFMFVRARRMELPQAASLAALLTAPASNACTELLDCEISLGWRSGGARPWEIRYSTLPFREGTSFDPSWLDR